MSDDRKKTKQQLLDELQELRKRLAERQAPDENPKQESHEPIFAGEVGRREVLKTAWLAPVILSIPVTMTVAGTRSAQAQPVPTMAPTNAPTVVPTTAAPTVFPTTAPTNAPTVAPTSFPTAAPTAANVPGLSMGGAAVMGGALVAAAAKKFLKAKGPEPKKTPSDDDSEGGDGSGNGGDPV